MSWAEVFKINSNMTKPLNTLISELISSLSTLVNTVNTNVTNTKTQVGTVNTTVNTINTATGTINTNVSSVKTSVDSIKTSVTSLGTQLTNVNNIVKDSRFLPMRVITTTGTYAPEKTGTYKVICVGAGGDGNYGSSSNTVGGGSGGGGGVAIKTLRLVSGTNYSVTVSTTASFTYNTSTIITAVAGGGGSYSGGGSGGTASGGDSNYTGVVGSNTRTAMMPAPATGSVGVFISELTKSPTPEYVEHGYVGGSYAYGDSILNYGGGGTGAGYYVSVDIRGGYATNGKPAAIIIIPLELEG